MLLLAVFSLLVYIVIRGALVKQFDASLASVARILAASVEADGDEIELGFEAQQMPEFQGTDPPIYYQLWRPDGTVVVKSPLLSTDNLSPIEGPLGELVFGASRDKKGQPQRSVGFKFIPRVADDDHESYKQLTNEQALSLVVARNASGLYRQLAFLKWVFLVASITVVTLSFLVAGFVVRKGLSSLTAIAAEIAAIREDDLTARIRTTFVPTEIVPIKNRLNDLLCRLQAAIKRERHFTADVSHELRTPLAGIRSTIEVTLARARNTGEYQAVLFDCLAIVESMQTMVNNLLMIARLDAGQVTFRQEHICLAELMSSCWRPFSQKAIEREITFANRVPNDVTVDSDRENLCMVLSNLLSNAVEYTNDAGQIWATANPADNCVEITVSNTGCSLTNEQVSQVFDCFWRGDSSRKDTGVHCGLGLALVERLVRALEGSVVVELPAGGIFVVRTTLPAKGERNSIE
jgi:signal transduction histidine kinase